MCVSLILEEIPNYCSESYGFAFSEPWIVIHILENNQQDTQFFSLICSN